MVLFSGKHCIICEDRCRVEAVWRTSVIWAPALGDRSINEIDAPVIVKGLREIEARGRYESARRLRSTVGSVFRYVIAMARAQSDPTSALRDALIRPKVSSQMPAAAVVISALRMTSNMTA